MDAAHSAAWTATDVGMGVESSSQGWGDWAKSTLASVGTTALDIATLGIGGTVAASANIGEQVAYAGGMAAADKLIDSSAESLSFGSGGIGFDKNGFGSQWNSVADYAEIAGAMVSTGVSNGLNATGKGFLGDQWANYQKVGSFAGSLASTAVTYGMTGSASLNLVNLGDFLNPTSTNYGQGDFRNARAGLLELDLGSSGATMQFGTGGTDVSASAMVGVGEGLGVYGVNAEIDAKAQALQAAGLKEDLSEGLRSLESSQDPRSKQNLALYDSIMNGTTTVKDNTTGDYAARTDANGDGTKTLTLGKDSSQFQGLNMSVLLAHESERTGEWKGDAGQVANTNEAVVDHMMMAQQIEANYGSGSLTGDLAHQAEVLTSYEKVIAPGSDATDAQKQAVAAELGGIMGSYDSSADYWKLMKDGTLKNDGRSSIFANDKNGQEHKILNLDNMTLAQSYEYLSGYTQKSPNDTSASVANTITPSSGLLGNLTMRKDLVTITQSYGLNQDQFDQVANSAWTNGKAEGLGYYLDLSSIKLSPSISGPSGYSLTNTSFAQMGLLTGTAYRANLDQTGSSLLPPNVSNENRTEQQDSQSPTDESFRLGSSAAQTMLDQQKELMAQQIMQKYPNLQKLANANLSSAQRNILGADTTQMSLRTGSGDSLTLALSVLASGSNQATLGTINVNQIVSGGTSFYNFTDTTINFNRYSVPASPLNAQTYQPIYDFYKNPATYNRLWNDTFGGWKR